MFTLSSKQHDSGISGMCSSTNGYYHTSDYTSPGVTHEEGRIGDALIPLNAIPTTRSQTKVGGWTEGTVTLPDDNHTRCYLQEDTSQGHHGSVEGWLF